VHGNPDLSAVVRPRALPLLTEFLSPTGPRKIWTTFSADQIDLNYTNPQVLLEIIDVLLTYVSHGAQLLRLDAIAYLWKKIGTSCIHLPETHAVIRIFRTVLDLTAPDVLLITETNVPHRENISYFGDSLPGSRRTDEADLVYQFPLAPLVLHTLASGDATAISAWISTLDAPGLFFNFIASHDGIGVTPAAGLIDTTQLEALVERTLAHGGRVSYKRNLDGSPSPYELNITLYDALNDPAHPDPAVDIPRFLASQAILLSLAGVPGIYVHSLFGSSNCERCFEETGQPRSTSRQKFMLDELAAQLADGDSRPALILSSYRRLVQARVSHPAFDPRGGQRVLVLPPQVFGLVRTSPEGNACVVCLVNVTSNLQTLAIDLVAAGLEEDAPAQDLISGASFPVHVGGQPLVLEGYQTVWLTSRRNGD
jgi:sucrose phosphorylase